MLLPLLRRGTGVLALAATFFACEGEPTPTASGNPDLTTPALPGAVQPIVFTHVGSPVYAADFPDPFVLVADSGYYAYATNRGSSNVPTLWSSDLVTWNPLGDAMPSLPAWAESGKRLTWAPSAIAIGGNYLLLYTARDRRSGRQCIGRAESKSPAGPFVDQSSAPFICQSELGGSIDASFVRHSSGELYVIWKNDGNCCGQPVQLWSQRLSSDSRLLWGERVGLLQRDQAWEGPLIEAPTMWEENGRWHLLYSANMWDSQLYSMGYAECDTPIGPCRKIGNGPVFQSDAQTAGPGGAETFMDREGRRWIAYHGWTASHVGYRQGGVRSFHLAAIAR
jgi:beta-xylosidase